MVRVLALLKALVVLVCAVATVTWASAMAAALRITGSVGRFRTVFDLIKTPGEHGSVDGCDE